MPVEAIKIDPAWTSAQIRSFREEISGKLWKLSEKRKEEEDQIRIAKECSFRIGDRVRLKWAHTGTWSDRPDDPWIGWTYLLTPENIGTITRIYINSAARLQVEIAFDVSAPGGRHPLSFDQDDIIKVSQTAKTTIKRNGEFNRGKKERSQSKHLSCGCKRQ